MMLGNFESCIEYKIDALRRGINVPIILTGRPSTEALKRIIDPPVDGYVGGIGRIGHRMRQQDGEIDRLDALVEEVSSVLSKKREEVAKDPLSVNPARLMAVLDDAMDITERSTHPTPITVQIRALRVKLPYDVYADSIAAIEIENGVRIGDITRILPSRMRDYILIRIRPFSETKIMV
jgi:putative methanogenesis marker protein 7